MLILATGGTFDKDYDLITGQLIFNDSQIPTIIQRARLTIAHRLQVVLQKDSLDMTLADRLLVLQACREAPEQQIVIVHGTDTMVETAHLLQEAALNKTILLTGAMRPSALGSSDADFNLGFAIACAQCLLADVYISMQGEIFSAQRVYKDRQQGLFLSK